MNEIEIFENFDQFDKIIKKQKKAKRIYKTSINRKKMVFYLFFALCFFICFYWSTISLYVSHLRITFWDTIFLYNRKIIF